METVDLDMDDLFAGGDDLDADGDLAQLAPMPDLDEDERPMAEQDENGEGNANGETDSEVLARLRDLSKGAAKKRVMKPQPKLDPDRLQGNRGIAVLPKLMKDVKFKGKGHEGEDLKLLMGKLEHWAHRLFPKVTFDEFIERMEKLGQKKSVQTCVKRIRLDIQVLEDEDDDIVPQKEGQGHGVDSLHTNHDEQTDMDAEEAFEEMMQQEKAQQRERQKETEQETDEVTGESPRRNAFSPERNGVSPERNGYNPASCSTPRSHTGSATPQSQTKAALTEEQRERMERMKRIAMEKRAARLGQTPGTSPSLSQPTASPATSKTDPTSKGKTDGEREGRKEQSQTEDEVMDMLESEEADISQNAPGAADNMRGSSSVSQDAPGAAENMSGSSPVSQDAPKAADNICGSSAVSQDAPGAADNMRGNSAVSQDAPGAADNMRGSSTVSQDAPETALSQDAPVKFWKGVEESHNSFHMTNTAAGEKDKKSQDINDEDGDESESSLNLQMTVTDSMEMEDEMGVEVQSEMGGEGRIQSEGDSGEGTLNLHLSMTEDVEMEGNEKSD